MSVSRAEGKLAGAVRAFSFDFRDKVVLDIGASTGGFTELALELRARKVIAVEKGTRQMKAPLRYDPRVELHEKTDILTVESAEDGGGLTGAEAPAAASVTRIAAPDVVLADVSFVSLREILHHVRKRITRGPTEWLVMLKPQFEARPDQLVKGVVKNERIRREIIKGFEQWLKQNGFVVRGKHDNEVAGKKGNVERFYWLTSK